MPDPITPETDPKPVELTRCEGSSCRGLLSDLELLHRQATCVEHLAEVLGEIARMQKHTAAYHAKHHPGIILQHGAFSAAVMEWLGNTLNGVDAVTEEDAERWKGTFEDAAARDWIGSLNAKILPP